MPYVQNDQIRIHYHVEGRGPALVLQHGLLGSLEDWHSFGYVTGLEDSYRLILIDQRGHGHSDKPYDSASYSLEQNTADVIAVLDDLKIPRASYFGYSMGGWIGFGVAKYASERFDSIIIGAAHLLVAGESGQVWGRFGGRFQPRS